VLEFFKHITSKRKILLLGFVLILLPGAVISYLSLQSINQKAENLSAKYRGTVSLVADKLESEVFQLETNLQNSVIETFPDPHHDKFLNIWLRNLESENPAFKHLYLIHTDGGLISSSVSLGLNKTPGSNFLINSQAAPHFIGAEKAEFIRKDFGDAIRLYKKAEDKEFNLEGHNIKGARNFRWSSDCSSILVKGIDNKNRYGIFRINVQTGNFTPVIPWRVGNQPIYIQSNCLVTEKLFFMWISIIPMVGQ
jgi:hypothetical protein